MRKSLNIVHNAKAELHKVSELLLRESSLAESRLLVSIHVTRDVRSR